jgi:hypothetical protein
MPRMGVAGEAMMAAEPNEQSEPQATDRGDRWIRKARQDRHQLLETIGEREAAEIEENALGLAFSGGGIRSATISLGIAQVLARHRRLLDFDYLSTVSGGGYIGSFLTSLFTPQGQRGTGGERAASIVSDLNTLWRRLWRREEVSSPNQYDLDELRDNRSFALKVLRDGSDERTFQPGPGEPAGERMQHPVWWLREHARYLAPNGMTDYLAAAYFMVRNWLAMLYVFALPILIGSLLVSGIMWPLIILPKGGGWPDWLPHLQLLGHGWFVVGGHILPKSPCGCQVDVLGATFYLSPVLVLAAVPAYLSAAAGTAFWLTSGGRVGRRSNAGRGLHLPSRLTIFLYAVATLAVAVPALAIARRWWTWLPWAVGDNLSIILSVGAVLAIGAILLLLVAGGIASHSHNDGFVIELRRILSRFGTLMMVVAIVILGFALVEMAAILVRVNLVKWFNDTPILTTLPPLLASASAWLINIAANSLSDKKGGWIDLVSKHLNAIALIAGLLLYAVFAVIAATVVQFIVWQPGSFGWDTHAQLQVGTLASFNANGIVVAFALLLFLTLFTGVSTGFINLSSLHNLYAARLTRAYVGGTNRNRLSGRLTRITETDPGDVIDIVRYQQQSTGAPLHLINATLNETLSADRSNLTDQDRKGVPITFGPEGVFVDASRADNEEAYLSWRALRANGVERLTVGQLCAISGAAASPGMGARTTLGSAMILTFANIRLGYWWRVNRIFKSPAGGDDPVGIRRIEDALNIGTYGYLLSEMLGRYKRHNRRVYLTDGGHFENSGAYELLRRGTRVIAVCDNGADPDYQFEDLQNLIRKARIDLGLDIRVASAANVQNLAGREGAKLFLNANDGDWRENAKSRECSGIALLLEVGSFADSDQERFLVRSPDRSRFIVWIKPCIFPEMREDLIGYALANPTFPQQTTADQFFDEAQWESYRMVGAELMNWLLNGTDLRADLFRTLAKA